MLMYRPCACPHLLVHVHAYVRREGSKQNDPPNSNAAASNDASSFLILKRCPHHCAPINHTFAVDQFEELVRRCIVLNYSMSLLHDIILCFMRMAQVFDSRFEIRLNAEMSPRQTKNDCVCV